jgi:hypothetical protein
MTMHRFHPTRYFDAIGVAARTVEERLPIPMDAPG